MIQTKEFNITGTRTRWYILSLILILPGIIALAIWRLNVGIDFKGGTIQEIRFENRPDIGEIRTQISEIKNEGITVQTSGEKDILLRFPNTEKVKPREIGDSISKKLGEKYNGVKEVSFETIGASVAQATTTKAIWAVILTSLAIILFIAWSFSGVPRPASSWRFGVTAILAMAHDILFMVGAFAIIGHFIPSVEVDALFITALLTILGFSVNDTIVVFDRIRENLRRVPGKTFAQIANSSLNQTLARSLNTSMTVLIVLLALLLLGGGSIRNFILALTLGVTIGTYSSIFNAAPLLVSWQEWVERRENKLARKLKK